MKKIATVVHVGAVTLSIALIGCTPRAEVASTAQTPSASTAAVGSSDAGPTTLHEYIIDNKIAEFRFKRGEPGTPAIEFAMPPGWSLAGDRTPDWAYGAIVDAKADDPEDPPYMVAIASKLTGDVDPSKILEYAPGQLNQLPDFTPIHAPRKGVLSGFQAVTYAGTYVRQGKPRMVGQQTIVVPGKDALFVLQLNGDAPKGQEQSVLDAAKIIAEQTKITAPS